MARFKCTLQVWILFHFISQDLKVLIIPVIGLLHIQLQHPVRICPAWVCEIRLVVVKVWSQPKNLSCPRRTYHTKVPHMPICIHEHCIGQQNTFPCFFEFSSQRCDVSIDHIIVITGIIKEETERIIRLKKFFRLNKVPGPDPFQELSDITVFCGIPSDALQYAADPNLNSGCCTGLQLV